MNRAKAFNDVVAGLRGCCLLDASFREATPLLYQGSCLTKGDVTYIDALFELFGLLRDQTPPAVRDESGENAGDCRHKRQRCLGGISKHHHCRTGHNDEQTQRGQRRQALANLEQAWKHQTQRAEYLGDGYGLQEHSRHVSLLFKGLRGYEQFSRPREQEN